MQIGLPGAILMPDMDPRLRAIYYPYSRCLNADFLRRSILLFDELHFLGASGAQAPIRMGDTYYSLLGRHGEGLSQKWESLRPAYELLASAGAICFHDLEE